MANTAQVSAGLPTGLPEQGRWLCGYDPPPQHPHVAYSPVQGHGNETMLSQGYANAYQSEGANNSASPVASNAYTWQRQHPANAPTREQLAFMNHRGRQYYGNSSGNVADQAPQSWRPADSSTGQYHARSQLMMELKKNPFLPPTFTPSRRHTMDAFEYSGQPHWSSNVGVEGVLRQASVSQPPPPVETDPTSSDVERTVAHEARRCYGTCEQSLRVHVGTFKGLCKAPDSKGEAKVSLKKQNDFLMAILFDDSGECKFHTDCVLRMFPISKGRLHRLTERKRRVMRGEDSHHALNGRPSNNRKRPETLQQFIDFVKSNRFLDQADPTGKTYRLQAGFRRIQGDHDTCLRVRFNLHQQAMSTPDHRRETISSGTAQAWFKTHFRDTMPPIASAKMGPPPPLTSGDASGEKRPKPESGGDDDEVEAKRSKSESPAESQRSVSSLQRRTARSPMASGGSGTDNPSTACRQDQLNGLMALGIAALVASAANMRPGTRFNWEPGSPTVVGSPSLD